MSISYTYSHGYTFGHGHFLMMMEFLADYLGYDYYHWYGPQTNDPLEIFFGRAGVNTSFTPQECRDIEPRLTKVLNLWEVDADSEEEYVQGVGLNLAKCMKRCADEGINLEFS